MTKCLAPLIFLASTIAPHAQNCPTFPRTENYACRTVIGKSSKPVFPLTIREGTTAGQRSYEIGTAESVQNLIVGSTSEQTLGGQTYTQTSTCEPYTRSKTRGPRDSVVLRTQVKGGAVVSETFFYQDGLAAVQMKFKTGENNGAPVEMRICDPVVGHSKQ